MHVWERNTAALDRMARRLLDDLAAAAEEARNNGGAAGDADALARASRAVMAARSALSGRLVVGRRVDDGRDESLSVDELAALLWEALTASVTALFMWRVGTRRRP